MPIIIFTLLEILANLNDKEMVFHGGCLWLPKHFEKRC